MLTDLRHLLRNLSRSPASAVAAVLTLVVTLGAGASIFAVVDAVLLTPPPFLDPDALVTVGEVPVDDPASAPRAVRLATFEAWRERAGSRARLEAYDPSNLTLTALGTAERLSATDVTPGFLAMLGVRPARGRAFEPGDVGQPLVIVSHDFWRTKLGADAGVIGRSLMLDGRAHIIVGVLPELPAFALNPCDVWRPVQLPADADARAGFPIRVVARLAPGATPADLSAALTEVSQRASSRLQAVATPMATEIAGAASQTLRLLAGATTFAMLVAFANLAGLLLVRSIDRRRELAVRTALGARPFEIVRQVVLEAETLVAMGLAGGVLLALWLTPVVRRLVLEQFGRVANYPVDVTWRVIVVVAVGAAISAALCGSLPALIAARRSAVDVLRRGVTPARREMAWRRTFVVGEVALACVLLVSLTLMGRSLRSLLAVNPGFDADGVLALQVTVPPARYPIEQVPMVFAALQRSIEQRLGTGTMSFVNELPLTGDGGRRLVRLGPTDPGREAVLRAAGPGYFEVMRIPIVAGRSFDERDAAAAPLRVVVSESLAEALFPREPAIGRQIRAQGPNGPAADIVGIVGDVRHRALDEPLVPTVYVPAQQTPSRGVVLVVRSARPDADVVAAVREAVARLDPDLPVYSVRSMRDEVARSPGVPARRVLTAAFLGFALLAVVLCGIGLFGVMAHDVASRRTELGLRIALGANPRRIVTGTLKQGAVLVGAGLAIGIVLSIWASQALSGMVVATGRFDLLSVAAAAVVLLVAAACAILPVARRAAHTDPLTALRSE